MRIFQPYADLQATSLQQYSTLTTTSRYHTSFGLWRRSNAAKPYRLLALILLGLSFSGCHFHKHASESSVESGTHNLDLGALRSQVFSLSVSDSLFLPALCGVWPFSDVQSRAGRLVFGKSSSFPPVDTSLLVPVAVRKTTVFGQDTSSMRAHQAQGYGKKVQKAVPMSLSTAIVISVVVLAVAALPVLLVVVAVPMLLRSGRRE